MLFWTSFGMPLVEVLGDRPFGTPLWGRPWGRPQQHIFGKFRIVLNSFSKNREKYYNFAENISWRNKGRKYQCSVRYIVTHRFLVSITDWIVSILVRLIYVVKKEKRKKYHKMLFFLPYLILSKEAQVKSPELMVPYCFLILTQ